MQHGVWQREGNLGVLGNIEGPHKTKDFEKIAIMLNTPFLKSH